MGVEPTYSDRFLIITTTRVDIFRCVIPLYYCFMCDKAIRIISCLYYFATAISQCYAVLWPVLLYHNYVNELLLMIAPL